MSTIVRYWPAVVAGLYLRYVLAAGKTDQLPPAVSAFVAAFGVTHIGVQAHARIAALKAPEGSK